MRLGRWFRIESTVVEHVMGVRIGRFHLMIGWRR